MVNLRELNMKLTKESLKQKITRDILIIQSIHSIDELISMTNKMVALVKERYGYYAPKISRGEDVNLILTNLYKKTKEEMAIEMTEEDLNSIIELGKEVENLNQIKESQEK